ncbi:hypothetical protein OG204_29855 [Streptomyces sp. NBC_01387]|nr:MULTISPECIES: hypothetical protein [unclassified Streptomyces]
MTPHVARGRRLALALFVTAIVASGVLVAVLLTYMDRGPGN